MLNLLLALCFYPSPAQAGALPKLASLFEQRLVQVEKRMAAYRETSDKRWRMARFTVGFFPRVGFKLPGVYELSVAGELDLIFVPDRE